MTTQYTEFLVALNGKSPRNLKDSVRHVSNASAGFRASWLAGERAEALETSQEAFEHLDYIQNELLRQRDMHMDNASAWATSAFKTSLNSPVGRLLDNVSAADSAWFVNLVQGLGSMPTGCSPGLLTLERALNKLKHRDTVALNFSLPANTGHVLYVLTKAGMGQPASLSEIDVSAFCLASKSAATHV